MNFFRFVRLGDFTWWIWFVSACLILLGLLVSPVYFLAAIAVSVAQMFLFIARERSIRSFAAQLRIAFVLMLAISYIEPLRILYWVPAIGIFAMLFTGYCLLARLLSLLPWNRTEPITGELLRRTFFRAPQLDATLSGRAASSCPGAVCTIEVQIGKAPRTSADA